MTTRGAVRTKRDAVYIRYDAYPSFVLDRMREEVLALGPEAALAELMDCDWSQVWGDPLDEQGEIPDRDDLPWDLAYVYDVDHDGVDVFMQHRGALRPWGRFEWDAIPKYSELCDMEQAWNDRLERYAL